VKSIIATNRKHCIIAQLPGASVQQIFGVWVAMDS